jgi:hypothetical protein
LLEANSLVTLFSPGTEAAPKAPYLWRREEGPRTRLSRERLEGKVDAERTSGEGSGVRALEGRSRVEPLGVRMGDEVLNESSRWRGVKERELGIRNGVARDDCVVVGVTLFMLLVLLAGCGSCCPGRFVVRMRSALCGCS